MTGCIVGEDAAGRASQVRRILKPGGRLLLRGCHRESLATIS